MSREIRVVHVGLGPIGQNIARLALETDGLKVVGAADKPIAEPCPDCGRSYLLEKETKKEGRVVFCGNEACHYKRQAA